MAFYNNVIAGAAGSGGAADFQIERSLRFDSTETSHLTRTPSTASNRRTWTWSGWVKRAKLGVSQHIFEGSLGPNDVVTFIRFESSDKIGIGSYDSGYQYQLITDQVFRDVSAWYSLVLSVNTTETTASDRVKLWVNGVQVTEFSTSSYPTQNYDTFVNNNSYHFIGKWHAGTTRNLDAYLAEVHLLDGIAVSNPDGVFGEFDATTGVWNPKRYSGSHGTNGFHLDFSDNSSNAALGTDSSGQNNTFTVNNINAASVTGSAPTVTGGGPGFPAENTAVANLWNGATSNYPGDFCTAADGGIITISWSVPYPGVTSLDYYSYNGSDRHDVNNGGWTNSGSGGGWKSAYSGSAISLSSLQLQKADGASYVKIGGIRINGTVLTTSNYSSPSYTADSFIDSPTDYEADSGNNGGNYATLNPLANSKFQSRPLSNGNLDFTGNTSASSGYPTAFSTIGMTSGKFYCEATVHNSTDTNGVYVGVCDKQMTTTEVAVGSTYPGGPGGNAYSAQGKMEQNSSVISTGNGTYTGGDVIGIAYDADNGKLYFSKNGTFVNSANPAGGTNPNLSNITGTQFFVFGGYENRGLIVNFGQAPFNTAPPTGFKSLCTKNLDTPLIADSSTAFEARTYDGVSGASSQTGYKFGPDFVWIKRRNSTNNHTLTDSVRGAGHILQSHNTNQEVDNTAYFTAFTSDGYSFGTDGGDTDAAGGTYVAWAWDGGDLATNSAYNQSAVWSDNLTTSGSASGSVTNAFDGNLTTQYQTSTGGAYTNPITFTPSGGLSYTSNVKVYCPSGQMAARINGGSWVSFTTDAVIATGSGSITTIEVTERRSSAGFGLYAIEVDGKILVDTGVIPAGSRPISTYNQSQKWTDFWSSTNGFEQNSQTFAFDLNDSNVSASASYGDTQSLVLTTGVAYTSSVRAMTHYTSGTAYINGNSSGAVNVASGWITLATGSGTLNRIDFTSSGARAYVSKIEVDGKLLVDPTPSIASTVRVNPTAGFSIVKYQAPGAGFFNVAHLLDATPGLIISKHTNRSSDWYVWHSAFTDDGDYISLNTTGGKSSATDFWSAAKPDSNAFGGKVDTSHLSGDTDIAYCFTPVEGYSAFGSYEGNGSTDGPFVYTGFRPALVIIKNMDAAGDWSILDTARDPNNRAENYLLANSSGAEASPGYFRDYLSNGFKIRDNGTGVNTNNQTYVYAAFAENPFKIARAR